MTMVRKREKCEQQNKLRRGRMRSVTKMKDNEKGSTSDKQRQTKLELQGEIREVRYKENNSQALGK